MRTGQLGRTNLVCSLRPKPFKPLELIFPLRIGLLGELVEQAWELVGSLLEYRLHLLQQHLVQARRLEVQMVLV